MDREDIINSIGFFDTEIDMIKEACQKNPKALTRLIGVKRVLEVNRDDLYEQLRKMGSYDQTSQSLKFEKGSVIVL